MKTNFKLQLISKYLRIFLPCLLAMVLTGACSANATEPNSKQENAKQEKSKQEVAPKKALTIKEIMKKAHKPAKPTEKIYLLKKVATGKATAAEAKQLHDYYKKLAKLKPTKGDQASWNAKTKALVDAAKAAVDKDANFKTKLTKASNCSSCHKVHK